MLTINIAQVEDEGNIVSIKGNIFLYSPQGHPILYKYLHADEDEAACILFSETIFARRISNKGMLYYSNKGIYLQIRVLQVLSKYCIFV